jgi:Ca2+-binding RTX toxin-like protein
VKAGAGADQVSGGGGNDDVSGGTGRDFIRGDTGDDILSGGHASDVLYGGLGNDTINGGTRNDFVDGGSGVDVLSGGSGADTFKIYGTTEITDFTSGTDKIEISMADWHVPGGTLHFQNRASPTLDTAELYFVAADHTLHYAPYGGSDDGSPIQSYLVATLDGVTSLSISDFDFVP